MDGAYHCPPSIDRIPNLSTTQSLQAVTAVLRSWNRESSYSIAGDHLSE